MRKQEKYIYLFLPNQYRKIKWSVVGQRISAVKARTTDTPSPDLFPTLPIMLTFYCGLLCVPSTVSRAVKDMTTKRP